MVSIVVWPGCGGRSTRVQCRHGCSSWGLPRRAECPTCTIGRSNFVHTPQDAYYHTRCYWLTSKGCSSQQSLQCFEGAWMPSNPSRQVNLLPIDWNIVSLLINHQFRVGWLCAPCPLQARLGWRCCCRVEERGGHQHPQQGLIIISY